jgi:hypothetical protein
MFMDREMLNEVRVYPLINPARPPTERPPIPVASFMSSRITDLFASASSYRVVASSGGLLSLTRRGREQRKEVCVCDLATGSGHLYVLLPPLEGDNNAADPPPSFRLLIADEVLRTQTFSSTEGGGWGPVTTTPWPPVWHHNIALMQRFPVVVGGIAHWLYREAGTQRVPFHVVALDVRTGQGRSFEVPQDCLRRLYGRCAYKNLVLAVDGGGKLIVVAAETNAFSAWTVPEDAGGRWVRSVLIERDVIFRSVTAPLCPPLGCQWFVFERSGSAEAGARSQARSAVEPIQRAHRRFSSFFLHVSSTAGVFPPFCIAVEAPASRISPSTRHFVYGPN